MTEHSVKSDDLDNLLRQERRNYKRKNFAEEEDDDNDEEDEDEWEEPKYQYSSKRQRETQMGRIRRKSSRLLERKEPKKRVRLEISVREGESNQKKLDDGRRKRGILKPSKLDHVHFKGENNQDR